MNKLFGIDKSLVENFQPLSAMDKGHLSKKKLLQTSVYNHSKRHNHQ